MFKKRAILNSIISDGDVAEVQPEVVTTSQQEYSQQSSQKRTTQKRGYLLLCVCF